MQDHALTKNRYLSLVFTNFDHDPIFLRGRRYVNIGKSSGLVEASFTKC
jgi:hypothetical protein